MPIIDFIKDHGVAFSIIRNEVAIASEIGLSDYDNKRKEKCIIFLPIVDIKEGDALAFPDSKFFHSTSTGKLSFIGLIIKQKRKWKKAHSLVQPSLTLGR